MRRSTKGDICTPSIINATIHHHVSIATERTNTARVACTPDMPQHPDGVRLGSRCRYHTPFTVYTYVARRRVQLLGESRGCDVVTWQGGHVTILSTASQDR